MAKMYHFLYNSEYKKWFSNNRSC